MPHTRAIMCYLGTSVVGLIFVALVTYFWPTTIPFGFFEFWKVHGSLWSAVIGAWPAYVFGMGLNAFRLFSKRDNYKESPSEILVMGFGISLWAGAMEEICFRWIIFLNGIVIIPIFDSFIHWVTGYHVIQWLYADIFSPVANTLTFGYLQPYLMGSYGWAVSAALLSSNGQFRNGHVYQGFVGSTISWFMGMYFFWLMFTYGLIASMLVHFLYDFSIFSIVCLDDAIERMQVRQRLARAKARVRQSKVLVSE